MWNQRAVSFGLAAFAGLLAAACSDVPATAPPAGEPAEPTLFGGPAPDPASFAGHVDRQFLRIAQVVPGFGGLFFDEAGTLNVYMTPATQPRSAAERSALGAALASLGVDLNGQPARMLVGRYDFAELHAMHERARPVLGLSGVVFTDADEARNRLHIGVEDAAAAEAVAHALEMLEVPREAVIVRETGPVQFTQSLRDRVRPVAGGLQIAFEGALGGTFTCTHGFNVRAPAAPGVHGFVTASHCTRQFGTADATPFWQPLPTPPAVASSDPNFIGTEVHDADFFTAPVGGCPAGRQCRWCDAAGIRYAPGVDNALGRIYRPVGLGSTVIDPVDPMFEITSIKPFPLVGDALDKVGRTTGWTAGTASNVCVNLNVSGTSITLLCQDIVQGGSQVVGPGDSGAPVFQFEPGSNSSIRLAGLLWGSGPGQNQYTFCAMDNLQFENPGPVPWRVFPPRF